VFKFTNLRGALVTMPHKVATMSLVDEVTPTARIAGAATRSCCAPTAALLGDQFDGAGFVRGVERKGSRCAGKRVLVSGCGGVGSAIAASLAAAGVSEMMLFDSYGTSAESLAARLREHYAALRVTTGSNDPGRLRPGRQRHAARHEGRRPAAVRRRAHRADDLRRRGRDEAGVTPPSEGRAGQGLPGAGRHRHAVRDDPRLPRILRVRQRHRGRTARGRADPLLSAGGSRGCFAPRLRGHAVPCMERAAEMRRVGEAALAPDLRHRVRMRPSRCSSWQARSSLALRMKAFGVTPLGTNRL
jgi:hypothetical protein